MMIALRKTGILNWLTYNTPQLFFFTTGTKKIISAAAQRAVWASSIIDLILKCDFESKPLRHHIINMNIPSDKYIFDEAIENDVKKMFTEGIKLRKEFLHQNRIVLGATGRNRFVFNPNYSVTRPIFNCISEFEASYFISGGYGISKTISIALYQHLSPYIHQFVFSSLKDSAQMEELMALQKEGLITRYPKCFYWSIGRPNLEKSQDLLKEILRQLVQLPEQTIRQLEKIESETKLSQTLADIYYQASIQNMVVIDQINLAASMIRRWNDKLYQWNKEIEAVKEEKRQLIRKFDELIETISQKNYKEDIIKKKQAEYEKLQKKQRSIKDKIDTNKDKQRRELKQPALGVIDQIQRFRTFGLLQIFTSSVNFERHILLKANQQKIGLNLLRDHLNRNDRRDPDDIRQLHINFSNAIRRQSGKRDFLDFFVFQMQRKMQATIQLASSKMPIPTEEDLEKYFLQNVKKHPLKGYYRFIFIRQYIAEKIKLMKKKKQVLEDHMQVQRISNQQEMPVAQQGQILQQSSQQMELEIQQKAKQRSTNLIVRNKEDISGKQRNDKEVERFLTIVSSKTSILKDFDNFCIEKSKSKIRQFLGLDKNVSVYSEFQETQNVIKVREEKMRLLRALFSLAKAHQQFGYLTFNFSINVYNQILGCKAETLFLDNKHNKELLPIQYDSEKSVITLHWTPSEFMELTREFVEPSLNTFYSEFIHGYIKRFADIRKQGSGGLFEHAIMELFSPESIIQFEFFGQKNENTSEKFCFSSITTFKSLRKFDTNIQSKKTSKKSSKKSKQFSDKEAKSQSEKSKDEEYDSFEKNFASVLELAKENPNKAIAASPSTPTGKFDETSPTIDFAIVRFNKKKQYDVFTFDVATTKNQDEINKKLASSEAFCNNLVNSSQNKKLYNFHHVVLCKEKLCVPKIVKENFSLTTSPYEKLTVLDYPQNRLFSYVFFIYFREMMENPETKAEDFKFDEGKKILSKREQ